MELIALEAQNRDIKISPSFLRKSRKIPAVYYGAGEKNMSLQLDYQTFRKAYMKAGKNQIVELQFDGKKKTVLIHDVQYNPLSNFFDHVDFIHVNMNEEVTARIPIEITGVAPAVKDLGGVLTTLQDELEVRCLPKNLPQVIVIDIASLDQLHSSIHISDVVVSKEVKLLGNPEDVILTVTPPRAEETTVAETATPVAAAESATAAGAPASTPASPAKG